jgi:hypothetical protein
MGQIQEALELLRLQILVVVQRLIGKPYRHINGGFYVGRHEASR